MDYELKSFLVCFNYFLFSCVSLYPQKHSPFHNSSFESKLSAIKMPLDQTTYFVHLNAALELGSRACKVYDEQHVEDEDVRNLRFAQKSEMINM